MTLYVSIQVLYRTDKELSVLGSSFKIFYNSQRAASHHLELAKQLVPPNLLVMTYKKGLNRRQKQSGWECLCQISVVLGHSQVC